MAEEQHRTAAEKEKAYLSLQRKLLVVFGIPGIILGYVSFALGQALQSMALAIVVYIVIFFVVKKAYNPEKKLGEKRKWWGTPIIVYFGLWIVVWTVLYNIFIVRAL